MSAAKLHRALGRHLGGSVSGNTHTPGAVTGLRWDPAGTTGNVFLAHMPDQPDVAVTIMAAGGRRQATKGAYDLPGVQLLVRHTAPHTGLDLAQAIYDQLACLDHVTLAAATADAVFVHGLTPQQSGPIPMGLDAARRYEWSLNFDSMIRNATSLRP